MLRAGAEKPHFELVNELVSMLDIVREWQGKALNNKSLTEAMSFLFRNRKSSIFPTAASFEVGVHAHLVDKGLPIMPAETLEIKPDSLAMVFNRFMWNLFSLHQSYAIDRNLGKLFAGYIDGIKDKETLVQELKVQQSSPNLQLIIEGINPGITSLNQNLLRINDILEAVELEQIEKEKEKTQLRLEAEAVAAFRTAQRIQKEKFEMDLEVTLLAEQQEQAALRKQKNDALAVTQPPLISILEEDLEAKSPLYEISHNTSALPSTASSTVSLTAGDSDESDFHLHSDDENPVDSTLTTDDDEKIAPLPQISAPKTPRHERRPSDSLSYQLAHSDEDENEAEQKVDACQSTLVEGLPSEDGRLNEQKQVADDTEHDASQGAFIVDLSSPDLSENEANHTINASPAGLAASLAEDLGEIKLDDENLNEDKQVADEKQAKLNALDACFNDLHWWNKMTSYKPLFGGSKVSVGDVSKRVPHHISVFKNSRNNVDMDAGIDEMIAAAQKQIPVVNKGFSFGSLFKSKPGTRICGLFQVRQAPMISLIQTVADFKNLSLAELTGELKKIRGNTDWQPILEAVAGNRQQNRMR